MLSTPKHSCNLSTILVYCRPSDSVKPLNNFRLSPQRLAAKNIAFSSWVQPFICQQRSKCNKYSLRGCFPSKSSGTFTGFLILRSAESSEDFSSFDTVSSRRKGLDGFTVTVSYERRCWFCETTITANGFDFTSERTKNWLTSSKSCLKGFCGVIGVEHRFHQCEVVIS